MEKENKKSLWASQGDFAAKLLLVVAGIIALMWVAQIGIFSPPVSESVQPAATLQPSNQEQQNEPPILVEETLLFGNGDKYVVSNNVCRFSISVLLDAQTFYSK